MNMVETSPRDLSDEQQSRMAEWLLNGLPFHIVQELTVKEFGRAFSHVALCLFWREVCCPELARRRRQAAEAARALAAEAAELPGRFDQATIAALEQKAFELAISPAAKAEDTRAIFSLVLQARAQELDREQFELEKQKFTQKLKSDLEKGLDALWAELKGNPPALELFQQFKALIAATK